MTGWSMPVAGGRLFLAAMLCAILAALTTAWLRLPPAPRALAGDGVREACRQQLEVARFMVAAEPVARRAIYGGRLWNAEAMAGDDLNILCVQSAARVIAEVGQAAIEDQPAFAGFACAAEFRLHEHYLYDPEYFAGGAVDFSGMAYMLRGMSMAEGWRRPRACAHFLTALRSAAMFDWLVTSPPHVTAEACRREVEVARAYFEGASRVAIPAVAAEHARVVDDVRIAYEGMVRAADRGEALECMIMASVVNRPFRRLYADLL